MFDGLLLNGGALGMDLLIAGEVGVGGHHIAQTLVIALVVVVLDEGFDLGFKVAGQIVVFQ
ncbi:hypothetical protein FHT60_003563 [Novosphingobium sp. BK486]|nr:hypothetical protein [Novosphingobium sp. BK256]MBB3376086.1 hypothetical protein [Novosphingobium sp. BK280]MBB3380320.1 hypothetical protein [Novosphingobium sp. BK258]MBB3422881.1 hypothetical protein [Novosphingobium sp. BK267]MBB3450851.1 hypothetical protein [Novosphingobium sp. BK352]MBB3479181.1 hypothetical protein [Novosphingobium sp. BK369]MBB3502495.1 hypothetical protein [Novosphingobium sp. BK336]MBB3538460.1 hypothetical protein [Novosphingobium sp. BK486]MBB3557676.1 hypo